MSFEKVEGSKVLYLCDSCGRRIQMGQGRYEGTYVAELEGTYCKACFPAEPFSPQDRSEEIRRLRLMKKR